MFLILVLKFIGEFHSVFRVPKLGHKWIYSGVKIKVNDVKMKAVFTFRTEPVRNHPADNQP
jgi:hypothetical protein